MILLNQNINKKRVSICNAPKKLDTFWGHFYEKKQKT